MIYEYEIIVTGRVQGAYYRDFVRRTAKAFGLNVTAKNMVNDNVKIVADLDENSKKLFLAKLKNRPSFARVDDIIITEFTTAKNYSDFKIIY